MCRSTCDKFHNLIKEGMKELNTPYIQYYKKLLHNLEDHKNEKRMSEKESELEHLEETKLGYCEF